MKKIAIVGGGLAGLATAYFLLKSEQVAVTLIEAKEIGAGASGVCSGLLHPYPGLMARRSYLAHEGLISTKHLLQIAQKYTPKVVACEKGILRQSLNQQQRDKLLEHCQKWKDVERIEEDLFLIHSGVTVLSKNYLEGLFAALMAMGLRYEIRKVASLRELDHYDHVVVAAGYGITQFEECLPLKVKFLKGQALTLEGKPPFDQSYIFKGYMAYSGEGLRYELGSTYEREFEDELANLPLAQELLLDKLILCQGSKIIECRAGVRVMALGQYLPLVEQVADKAHVFTGLGSRGLLYHALFAKALCAKLLSNNPQLV